MLLNDDDAALHKDLMQLGNVSMMTMTGQAEILLKEGSKAGRLAALPSEHLGGCPPVYGYMPKTVPDAEPWNSASFLGNGFTGGPNCNYGYFSKTFVVFQFGSTVLEM